MDLAPTFLEVAGLKAPEIMNGKSIVPLLASGKSGMVDPTWNFVLTGRERHVAGVREVNLPYPQRAIRTNDYLYIRNFKPNRYPIGALENGLPDIDGGPTKTWFIKNRDNPEYQYEWNLAFGLRPHEELYKIMEDPYEVNNLAGKPEYDKIRRKSAMMMDSLIVETKDPRINNDDCIFDKMPYIILP
jgi:N-sulfoglucosamine sulfohydrolase